MKCNWPLGNGQNLEFNVHNKNEGWNSVGGLYIFTYLENGYLRPLYIGQTNDFSSRLPSHERLNEAIKLGATHIHAVAINTQAQRDSLERALIEHLQPSLNTQHA